MVEGVGIEPTTVYLQGSLAPLDHAPPHYIFLVRVDGFEPPYRSSKPRSLDQTSPHSVEVEKGLEPLAF